LTVLAAYLTLSIAIAALVYRFFEAPILAWRDRHFLIHSPP
jgi:peptidoglycan/LPS O-acetylase OafA/YrhL